PRLHRRRRKNSHSTQRNIPRPRLQRPAARAIGIRNDRQRTPQSHPRPNSPRGIATGLIAFHFRERLLQNGRRKIHYRTLSYGRPFSPTAFTLPIGGPIARG